MANQNTALANELLELEKQYWMALKNEDYERAIELTHDPCIVTGAQGVGQIDRKTYREMMTKQSSPVWKVKDFELSEPTVQMLTDDVAVLAYKVHEDMTVDGKPLSLDAADASTWVRRNGSWLCALHTESILGDPFGRDKKPS
jgi:uncharacterized protein (TIGR02246 family)